MRISVIAALILVFGRIDCLGSGYGPNELFTIEWGDGPNQLKIGEPAFNDINQTPDDSTDDYIERQGGPSYGFVDIHENIYFSSYDAFQLKAFDNSDGLIFDYSLGTPGYNREFYSGWLRDIYVDSLQRIYILGGAKQDYIAVVDTAGHLMEKLNPFGPNSAVVVGGMYFNSEDVLSIHLIPRTFYTYSKGSFSEGGAMGWKALDGYYYYADYEDSLLIRFIRHETPDITGAVTNLQETFREYEIPPAASFTFLGVDDAMNIYVYECEREFEKVRVLVFNTAYELIDQIIFPDLGNRYLWYMRPFMRPSDGNVYEFRCLDDGLHVVRWSKE